MKQFSKFELPAGARLTPAAAQFLSERKITVTGQQAGKPTSPAIVPATAEFPPDGGISSTRAPAAEKQEYQTHLRGRQLVIKSHPRIKMRGKLDHLEAEVIISIIDARQAGLESLAKDLQWFLDFLRQVMKAEVTEATLPEISFCSLSSEQIRTYSHHPEEYIGVCHFMPEAAHGMLMARLNLLRTLVRQVELAAVDAFCQGDQVDRKDLLTALNRASSVVYILMCRLLAGGYYKLAVT